MVAATRRVMLRGAVCWLAHRVPTGGCSLMDVSQSAPQKLSVHALPWMFLSNVSQRSHAVLAPAGQAGSVFRGTYALDEPDFDWGAGYVRPAIPPQELVIYEMGVRSFTASASAGLPAGAAGTFAGMQAKACT